jgi:predicted nucleotidyltransferase
VDCEALAALCRENDLDLVILFGSRARGLPSRDSDSDVGVLRRSGLVPADRFLKLAFQLAQVTSLPDVDLVDLRRAPPLLQFLVARDGRVLYESEPGVFNLYYVRAWKLYLDDQATLRRWDTTYIRESLARLRR